MFCVEDTVTGRAEGGLESPAEHLDLHTTTQRDAE